MFISYTATTITSQLELSTTASCLVSLCWSFNIHVGPHPSYLDLSMSTLLPSRVARLFISMPSLGIINFHHTPAEPVQSSVMQSVTPSTSVAMLANPSDESVASSYLPYCIHHLHTCLPTKSNLKLLLAPALVSYWFSLSLIYHPKKKNQKKKENNQKIFPLNLQLQGQGSAGRHLQTANLREVECYF